MSTKKWKFFKKFFQFPILDMKNAEKRLKKFMGTSELDIQL